MEGKLVKNTSTMNVFCSNMSAPATLPSRLEPVNEVSKLFASPCSLGNGSGFLRLSRDVFVGSSIFNIYFDFIISILYFELVYFF